MPRLKRTLASLILVAGVSFGAAHAQQIYGTPGAPSATESLAGKQLPPAPAGFGGVINERASASKPYWPARVVPPKGAPNVLLIMTDDVGFGAPSTFGGVIPTPALDRIAKIGLRYTQFHSTALCSPSRAALITGRNHHTVGFGVISEMATGYPGYDSVIEKTNGKLCGGPLNTACDPRNSSSSRPTTAPHFTADYFFLQRAQSPAKFL